MTIRGLFPYTTETQKKRKRLEQKFVPQLGKLYPHGIIATPVLSSLYSKFHVTIFPPMTKLIHTLMKPTAAYDSFHLL